MSEEEVVNLSPLSGKLALDSKATLLLIVTQVAYFTFAFSFYSQRERI